jgi:hypothetical protein|tara:strand:+ start:39 stop:461 length:423 start_codon:yes stop_codon:yes gene_type:complete
MSDTDRFVNNGDGTTKDTQTGLIWSLKDSWHIEQDWLDLTEALAFVDKMNKEAYLGFWDWRIPERDEAEKIHMPDSTILARSKTEIHIDPVFEPGGGNGCWCLPFDQQAAFYLSYSTGMCQTFDKDFSQGYVRLVRLYGD